MSRRNSIILALLFVILVVEIVILAPDELGLSPQEDQAANKTPATTAADTEGSSQIMRDVHLVEARPEGKEWELWAEKALRPRDNERWTIDQVRVKFFADNGVTYTVTGKKGFVVPTESDKSDIRIEGNVETKSSNGYMFRAPSAHYDAKTRKLVSTQSVEMIGPQASEERNIVLNGESMTADFVSNEISINRSVRARKRVGNVDGEERIVTIQSQRALFSGRSNLAQFFGNVVIEMDTMRITGPLAKFAFDAKSDGLQSMEVTGGVRVTDMDKFATSGSLSLFLKEDKVVFNGSPRVVQSGDEIVGDQIVITDGGKKVEISNAKAQFDPKALEKKN